MAKIEMNLKSNKQPESRIPVLSPAPLRRSGSLRLGVCPPIQEHHSDQTPRPKLNRHRSLQSLNTSWSVGGERDDDLESVRSCSSTASVCSSVSQCDHAHFARNGTTYSGRSKRYVVHCSPHSTDTDDYLTPTQRTNRTIRKLRNLLKDAQSELIEKDKEILRLTKEVVELRLLKADSAAEPNDVNGDGPSQEYMESKKDNQLSRNDQLTTSPRPRYCSSPPLAQSLSDSGHFEDLNSSREHAHASQPHINHIKTLESLQSQYEDEIRELKERHNDKVDSLLQRITDVNDRYYALRPLYEDCKERLHELEKENEELNNCQSHSTKIDELQTSNDTLFEEKRALEVEVNNLKQLISELELSKSSHDKLEVKDIQLRNRKDELLVALKDLKEETSQIEGTQSESRPGCALLDGTSQTEDINMRQGGEDETVSTSCCQQNKPCTYQMENSELKSQIVAHIEKIKQLEGHGQSEKEIYVQLYKKGIQAAKLSDSKDIEIEQNDEKDNSLIPDLLQKLRIKQEELDNVKAMYRRLLETRKTQPKHDPEMTLQFLKSAFYYFLTDRENAQGHLAAIESILGFTENEKINIERAFLWR